MTQIEELMNRLQLTSSQLLDLKETLNKTEFMKIEDLWFGFLVKNEHSQIYGWGDGSGNSSHSRTSYSDVLLINRCNKTDAFTGKELEESWSSQEPDFGKTSRNINIEFFKQNPSLGEQARRYKVSYQSVYCQCEMSSLLTTYLECVRNISMRLTANDWAVTLPNYQYELVGGEVKSLKPLNYHELK